MTYELHPLCTLFPRLAGAEFDALCADIKANGLRSPIVLHDGMILDGGNRYRACEAAGVAPQFEQFDGGNIVSFVLSVNLHRRHMTTGQQAAIVSSATDWAKAHTHGGNRKHDQAELGPLETVKQRAAVSGANEKTQRKADTLVRENPTKAREVAQGKTSLYMATKPTKPAPAAKPEPKKTAQEIERDRLAEEAYGDIDPLAELEKAHAEVRTLTEEVAAMSADDAKAETLKWRRMYDAAVREQSKYMELCDQAKKREAWNARQLARCGKAVNQSDPEKIAAAVEAFARARGMVAA